MKVLKSSLALGCLVLLMIPARAQDVWEPFRSLEGTWEGTGDGVSGRSTVIQTYAFILKGNFLRIESRAEFKPQEKNPGGEIHEDVAIVSYDSARKTFVMRGFYVEGFVNRYVLRTDGEEGTLDFVTESVENGPPGTKARLVLRKIDDTTLEEQFFVAFPGQELSCYTTNTLKKKD